MSSTETHPSPSASGATSPADPARLTVDEATLRELRGKAIAVDRSQAVIELDLDGHVLRDLDLAALAALAASVAR